MKYTILMELDPDLTEHFGHEKTWLAREAHELAFRFESIGRKVGDPEFVGSDGEDILIEIELPED